MQKILYGSGKESFPRFRSPLFRKPQTVAILPVIAKLIPLTGSFLEQLRQRDEGESNSCATEGKRDPAFSIPAKRGAKA